MAGKDTRERIVVASAGLLGRQGYHATGIKEIVRAAGAPFGSIYHFFPDGKEQLGAEAIRRSGAEYEELIGAVFGPAPDPVAAVGDFFAAAAEHLRETDYADACPIATVALEVASISEPLRRATADVFESWIATASARFAGAGLAPGPARELVIGILCGLEGAFILARSLRSTEPVEVAGKAAVEATRRALADAGGESPAGGSTAGAGQRGR
jgi:AcrR family transcriptional regulator